MSEIQRWDFVVGEDCSPDGTDFCGMYPAKESGNYVKHADHLAITNELRENQAVLAQEVDKLTALLLKYRAGLNCVCKINAIVAPLGAGIECQACAIDAALKGE